MPDRDERSAVLPTDPYDIRLADVMRAANGVHTPAQTVQYIDPYGNSTQYTILTVKDALGEYAFVTQTSAAGMVRYVLPPKVLALIDRQRQHTITQVRRRHGRRLAEERGPVNPFTPEMRAKALESRRRNARKRAAGRA